MSLKERIWREWDEALKAGKKPHDILADLTDESLLAHIATAGPGRKYETRLLRTEALRRITTARRRESGTVDAEAQRIRRALDDAAAEIHAEETVVENRVRAEGREPPTPETDLVHAASQEIEIARASIEDRVEAEEHLHDVGRKPGPDGEERV